MEKIRNTVERLSSTDVSVQENCLRILINLSTEKLLSSENQDIAEKALWLLTNLTLNLDHSHLLVDYGVVDSLINFLKRPHNPGLVILSSVPLRNLLHKDTCGEYLDNQKTFCHSGAVQSITKILTSRYPAPSNELILSLTSIILVLTIYHPLIRRIIAISGVLNQLISYLSSPSCPISIKEQVMKILINLSLTEETELPILQAGAMMPLVDIVVSISSTPQLKSLAVSCLANLTANGNIRKVLRSKYLIDGLCELLKDKNSHTSQLLEAISLLIANLSIDEICRYKITQSECDRALSELINYPHTQVRDSIIKALENIKVPVSLETQSELVQTTEDLSDLDPTDSLGISLSLSPSPIKKGILRYSRSVSPVPTVKPQGSSSLLDASESCSTGPQTDDSNLSFRRGKIIKEILDTEQAYVHALSVCIRVYYNPLVVSPTNPPIIPLDMVETIFSNIDKVFRVNCEFLKKLRSITAEKIDIIELAQSFQWLWDQPSTIPEYRHYINGFNRAMDTVHENRPKLPRFKEYLEKCQFSDQCKSETIDSYLIRPVQRIFRYILLLSDLLVHTVDILERNSIEDALKRSKSVVDQLNESKRKAENQAKTLILQDKVVGLTEGFSLTNGGTRHLLKEGLMMEARQKKVSKYRYLLLFSDTLYITKQKKSKYVIQKTIPLIDLKVIEVSEQTSGIENSFQILWSRQNDRKENDMLICSSKPEEKDEWVKELKDACNHIKKSHLQNILKSQQYPRVE
eukprot:gene11570-14172_t